MLRCCDWSRAGVASEHDSVLLLLDPNDGHSPPRRASRIGTSESRPTSPRRPDRWDPEWVTVVIVSHDPVRDGPLPRLWHWAGSAALVPAPFDRSRDSESAQMCGVPSSCCRRTFPGTTGSSEDLC